MALLDRIKNRAVLEAQDQTRSTSFERAASASDKIAGIIRRGNGIFKQYKIPQKMLNIDIADIYAGSSDIEHFTTIQEIMTITKNRPRAGGGVQDNIQPLFTTVNLSNIKLPFPQDISVSSQFDWQSEELQLIGEAVKTSGLSDGLVNEQNQRAAGSKILANAATEASRIITGNDTAAKALHAKQGKVLNPKAEVLFNGVRHRSFDLTWDLAPKTEQESINIMGFLKRIHEIASPTITNDGTFFNYPETVVVKIQDENGRVIIDRGDCAIVGIDVNLTPESIWATFTNGSPVHVTVTISFIELELPTKGKNAALFGG